MNFKVHTHGHSRLLWRVVYLVFVVHNWKSASVHASSGYLKVVVCLVYNYVLYATVLEETISYLCAKFPLINNYVQNLLMLSNQKWSVRRNETLLKLGGQDDLYTSFWY